MLSLILPSEKSKADLCRHVKWEIQLATMALLKPSRRFIFSGYSTTAVPRQKTGEYRLKRQFKMYISGGDS